MGKEDCRKYETNDGLSAYGIVVLKQVDIVQYSFYKKAS